MFFVTSVFTSLKKCSSVQQHIQRGHTHAASLQLLWAGDLLASPRPSPEPEHMIEQRIQCQPHRGHIDQWERRTGRLWRLEDLDLIFVRYNLARRSHTHFWFSKVFEAQIKKNRCNRRSFLMNILFLGQKQKTIPLVISTQITEHKHSSKATALLLA